MPPLTLEQVLARSMRLPRQRAKQSISSLFSSNNNKPSLTGDSSVGTGDSPAGIPTFSDVPSGEGSGTVPSTSSELFSRRSSKHTASFASRGRSDVLNFFKMVEELDRAKQSSHPTFTVSSRVVNNSPDLLSHLKMARSISSWEEAISVFTQSTDTKVTQNPETNLWEWRQGGSEASEPVPSSSSSWGVNVREEHLFLLLDTLLESNQWGLIRSIGEYYGKTIPNVFTYVVQLLALYAEVPPEMEDDASIMKARIDAAWGYLRHNRLPPPEQPVEAYNECIAACERAKDWQRALQIIRAMGPNPLQNWRSSEERELDGDAQPSELSPLSPPSPNVVSYANLIAALEQNGKDKMASEVLLRLPPLEQAEITASYAALIHVWSKQLYTKQQKRF